MFVIMHAIAQDSNFPIHNSKFYIKGGGVRNGRGNIIQHNSLGTVYIQNFYAENSEQLYSSCEDCREGKFEGIFEYQGKRSSVTLENIKFDGGKHVCKKIEGRKDGKEVRVLGYKYESSSISK